MKNSIFALLVLSAAIVTVPVVPRPGQAQPLTINPSSIPNEIAVTGDAHFNAPPNRFVATLVFEQQANGAAEGAKQLEGKVNSYAGQLKSAGMSDSLRVRSHILSGPAGGPVKPGQALVLKRVAAVESEDVNRLWSAIDSALAGGATLQSFQSFVGDSSAAQRAAAATAGERAAAKAADVATALGVRLGTVLSASVVEEPEGEALRAQLTSGGVAERFGDQDRRVYVTVRYAVTSAR